MLMRDSDFVDHMNELNVQIFFKDVVNNSLGNHKVSNYGELVKERMFRTTWC